MVLFEISEDKIKGSLTKRYPSAVKFIRFNSYWSCL